MTDPVTTASGGKGLPPVRDRIIDALMSLATATNWRDIDVSTIADEADISLVEFRDAFPSKGTVFAAFWRRIDSEVLKNAGQNTHGESHRERLFDLYMRRLDALASYKTALRKLLPQLCREPLTLASLNRQALNAQRFLLAAAGIRSEGALGQLRLQGAVTLFARTMEIWLKDESAELDKTMASLDRGLRRAERVNEKATGFRHVATPLCDIGGALLKFGGRLAGCRTRRKHHDEHDPAAAI